MESNIPWTQATIQTHFGCSWHSRGCDNCYAARLAATRLKHHPHYEGLALIDADGVARWTDAIRFDVDSIESVLRMKKPRRIFIDSMSDLFSYKVPQEHIDRVIAVAWLSWWSRMPDGTPHTFLLLTKRPERMLHALTHPGRLDAWTRAISKMEGETTANAFYKSMQNCPHQLPPNLWTGVTVEDNDCVHRVESLMEIPSIVRFVSVEPMLSSVDLELDRYPVDWVICGCESGQRRRYTRPEWVRDLRGQCVRAGVPFFVKQVTSTPTSPVIHMPEIDGRKWAQYPEASR